MSYYQSLHEALRVEEIGKHSTSSLEYAVVKLQNGRTDIRYTLHARPQLVTFSGNMGAGDLLQRIGFIFGDCPFFPHRQCLARVISADFDVAGFAKTVERAFSELQEGIRVLFECGFYVEHRLFGSSLPPVVAQMFSPSGGDGHTAPKKTAMKQSEDAIFDYRLTWLEGGHNKGWAFHYGPKHPLSEEVSSLLSFLGIRKFPECPEYDFAPCGWRFLNYVDTGDVFFGAAELAHKWFDSHATQFAPGLQKLLDAHATLNTFGFDLLPSVRANVPPEAVQPPKARKPLAPKTPSTATSVTYDVAVSFAGVQRDIAATIATRVRDAGFEVFYDNFFPEQLWGKDLAVFFADVFSKTSRYVLILVSKDYIASPWANHERQSAVARAIQEKGKEYILPVRVDDTELPGVADTVAYLSLTKYSAEQIADLLIAKLKT